MLKNRAKLFIITMMAIKNKALGILLSALFELNQCVFIFYFVIKINCSAYLSEYILV